jgi:hypothetical protein
VDTGASEAQAKQGATIKLTHYRSRTILKCRRLLERSCARSAARAGSISTCGQLEGAADTREPDGQTMALIPVNRKMTFSYGD